jgi:uncharacterized protein YcaQ
LPSVRGALRLSRHEVRQIAVAAQFGVADAAPVSPAGILERLGVIQLDALQRVDRSHRLVCFARDGALRGHADIDGAFWTTDGDAFAFEAWAHAVCLIPVASWPLWAPHRESTRGVSWAPPGKVRDRLVRLIRDTGPQTITELEAGQARSSGWDWSETKRAAEYLVWTGGLVCCARRGTRRLYDVPQRRIPAALLEQEISTEDAIAELVLIAARAYGAATVTELAGYFTLSRDRVAAAVERCGLIRADAEGWPETAWLHPAALSQPAPPPEAVLVSPFDNLIWDRARVRRIFGFEYVFEAYKPAAKRIYGCYVMPLLVDGEIRGRADVKRDKRTLRVLRFFPEGSGVDPGVVAAAASRLATQLSCECVHIDPNEVGMPRD